MSDADATSADRAGTKKARKARLSQEDVPGYSLEQALRVAQTIADNNAYRPTRPLAVAQGMNVMPSSGGFRGITGAAVAYGLTTGAYNSSEIGLTPIGMRIVRPTTEGDDMSAKREALLKPRIVGDFLRHYDGAALPSDAIAKNVLADKGVPADRLDDVYALIVDGANAVGFISEWSGKRFVDLAGANQGGVPASAGEPTATVDTTPRSSTAPLAPTPIAPSPNVSVSSGVNINIEIHIAADASTQTIDDIFRSMRRYVLKPEDVTENDD